MSSISVSCSDRDRKCRLCNQKIERKERALVMENVRVSPKTVDLHFYTKCLTMAVNLVAEQDADSPDYDWKGLCRDFIAQGMKVNAIKVYRDSTGLGLKESKDAVDAMTEQFLKEKKGGLINE